MKKHARLCGALAGGVIAIHAVTAVAQVGSRGSSAPGPAVNSSAPYRPSIEIAQSGGTEPAQESAELRKMRQDLVEMQRVLNETNDKLVETQEKVVKLSGMIVDSGPLPLAASVVPASDFMPPPANPKNMFFNETRLADTNLGAGTRIAGTGAMFRAVATGSVHMFYDTGNVGGAASLDPASIAIGGASARGAGSFNATNFGGELLFDLNIPLFSSGSEGVERDQAQAFVETDFVDGDLRVRNAYGRVSYATLNVLAGSYWTTWGDEGTIPKSLNSDDTFPVGANTESNVPQLRFAIPTGCHCVTTFAIQDPRSGAISLGPDDVVLHRYPDLAARIRYFDGDFASLSLGAIWHVIGRDDFAGNEDFESGWGISAATRFRTSPCGALMAGAVVGEGISGSIFGLSDTFAARTDNHDLILLANYGAYLGYQHDWSPCLITTAAYGFAQGEGSRTDPDNTRTVQNAWINAIYKVNYNFAFGLQYEFGDREQNDGDRGENHRIGLVVSIRTGSEKASGESAARSLSADTADAVREEVRKGVPTDSGASRFSRI
jgi:hypothetical protein